MTTKLCQHDALTFRSGAYYLQCDTCGEWWVARTRDADIPDHFRGPTGLSGQRRTAAPIEGTEERREPVAPSPFRDPSPEMLAMARRVLDRPPMTEQQIIDGGVAFVMGPGGDEGTRMAQPGEPLGEPTPRTPPPKMEELGAPFARVLADNFERLITRNPAPDASAAPDLTAYRDITGPVADEKRAAWERSTERLIARYAPAITADVRDDAEWSVCVQLREFARELLSERAK